MGEETFRKDLLTFFSCQPDEGLHQTAEVQGADGHQVLPGLPGPVGRCRRLVPVRLRRVGVIDEDLHLVAGQLRAGESLLMVIIDPSSPPYHHYHLIIITITDLFSPSYRLLNTALSSPSSSLASLHHFSSSSLHQPSTSKLRDCHILYSSHLCMHNSIFVLPFFLFLRTIPASILVSLSLSLPLSFTLSF